MHILVLTPSFPPETTAAAVRTSAHARIWTELGHTVTVVSSAPNFPRGKLFDGYENRWLQEQTVAGVRNVMLWTYMAPNEGVLRRTADYASFMASAYWQSRRLPKADVILATSPHIFVAIAGHLVARRLQIPWVFEVRDLWPAAIAGVGMGRSSVLKAVEAVELGLYRSARRVIVLTQPFKDDLVRRGIDPGRIDVVTNGMDDGFAARRSREETRRHLGYGEDTFLVGYVGTLGLCQNPAVLVRAAWRLRDRADIQFLIVGEGAERAKTEDLARSLGLANVVFRDLVPYDEVPDILSALDLGTVVLRDHPAFHTVIPSKIFELAAVRRPIVGAVTGEAKRVITEIDGGICVPPGDDEALAAAILQLVTAPDMRARLGERGAKNVQTAYARRPQAKKALDSLTLAAAGKRERELV